MKLILPKLSATMEEGTIVKWSKNAGDSIREGDILYEVETDKTTMEVESSVTGVLVQILVPAGKSKATGTEICEITLDAAKDTMTQRADDIPIEPSTHSVKHPIAPSSSSTMKFVGAVATAERDRIRISPSARRLARLWDIDIHHIPGSGPMGRIRNRDVEAFVEQLASPPASQSFPASAEPSVAVRSDISKMRMTLAKELLRSTQTIPSFWVEKWVNAEVLLNWKDLLKQTQGQAFSQLTITDFLLHAIGLALLEMPSVNRRWVVNAQGQASIQAISGSHVGLAVSVVDGIISPIVPHVGERLLSELIVMRNNAVQSSRNYKPYGIQEPAAITLSNLGNTGIDRFQAIIKPDEAMILAVGGLNEKATSVNGQLVMHRGFNLVLSADHRVLDGVDAAKFLAKIAEILETGAWKIA